MWTIGEAQRLISKMQPKALDCNFNLALAGGVLDKEYSNKDLDIVCLPRSRKSADRDKLIEEMRSIVECFADGWDIRVEDLGDDNSYGDSLDGRVVYMMEFKIGDALIHTVKRIDWIFVDY